MPTFQDSDNIPQCVAEGDYVFRVIEFEQGISAGGRTAGSTKYAMKCAVELPDGKSGPYFYEHLIDHESSAWKIDTFLKSAGVALAKGAAFEFDRAEAERLGVPHVEPVGLRGWCRLVVDDYNGKKRNKAATFYTDKEKLPRVATVINEDDVPFDFATLELSDPAHRPRSAKREGHNS